MQSNLHLLTLNALCHVFFNFCNLGTSCEIMESLIIYLYIKCISISKKARRSGELRFDVININEEEDSTQYCALRITIFYHSTFRFSPVNCNLLRSIL